MKFDNSLLIEAINIINSSKYHVYYDYLKDELLTYITPPKELEPHPGDFNLVYLGKL